MKLRHRLGAAASLCGVRLLGRRVPVAARVNLVNRCHSRCAYCSFWKTSSDELSTRQWLSIFNQLGRLGTKRLSVSGGEPMLRDDIGELLAGATAAGMSVGLNSTGFLFGRKREALKSVELVKLSLDGGPEVHDSVRGRPGAFEELREAVAVAREVGVRLSFVLTMTRRALPEIPFVLEFGREHGALVTFQPVMAHEHADPQTRATFPDKEEFDEAVALLLETRRREPGLVRNSEGGLRALLAWPHFEGVDCVAGRAMLMIEANGDAVPCDRIAYDGPIPNAAELGVAGAWAQLPEVHCGGCGFSGSLELNRLMSLRPGAAGSVLRVVADGGGARSAAGEPG